MNKINSSIPPLLVIKCWLFSLIFSATKAKEEKFYLVEPNLGNLVRNTGPVSLGHEIPESTSWENLSHLEKVLLLFSLALRGSCRVCRWFRRGRRSRRSGTEVSEEAEWVSQEDPRLIPRSSIQESCGRHFRIRALFCVFRSRNQCLKHTQRQQRIT